MARAVHSLSPNRRTDFVHERPNLVGPQEALVTKGLLLVAPFAAAVATSSRSHWDAKDVIIVVAAIGFVLLLIAGAFVVKRRGED
jgi:hypothetical protein